MPIKMLRLKIDCLHARDKKNLKIRNIKKFCSNVFGAEGICQCECGIIFVDNNYIKDINLSFFKKNRPTDVISFPLHGDEDRKIEGEIYISIEQAAIQAENYGVSLNNELQRLLIHGILHILGYDDQTSAQKKRMTMGENKYINTFGAIILHSV